MNFIFKEVLIKILKLIKSCTKNQLFKIILNTYIKIKISLDINYILSAEIIN